MTLIVSCDLDKHRVQEAALQDSTDTGNHHHRHEHMLVYLPPRVLSVAGHALLYLAAVKMLDRCS
jgi:hypothetical protein